jgi:predicted nucleic acid-binding protein
MSTDEGVFLDTSGLFSVFHKDDLRHSLGARAWRLLAESDVPLHTSNYVLVELASLVQKRLGLGAVDALSSHVLPWVNVTWIDAALHAQAVAGVLAARQPDLSLVDCASFALMRHLGLRRAFTFDRHYAEQGFEILT